MLSADPETGEITYKEVLDTFQNETDTVVHVKINNESFTCTEEHPFYVEGKGWVNASALRPGMVVWLSDGTKTIIQDVWIEYLAEAIAVFNFKVDDFHTYFIGYSGILVHNADCGKQPVQAYEVTDYADFKDRSVVGDQLEGHEIWQFANVNEQGYASSRAAGDVGGGNIVIALPHDVHVQVTAAQATLSARSQTPLENIAANIDILRNVLGETPDATSVDIDTLATRVYDFYKSVANTN